MELLQLRYFQKVAEFGSFSKAARHFSIPQPSMSQTISRLEKDLNVRLFERHKGKIFLNENGRTFLAYAEKALQALDNGVLAVTDNSAKISDPVSIKIMENHRFILTCIPKFSRLYPDVSISVSHGYYEDPDVVYDFCISSKTTYKRMTARTQILRERVILAVHEDHPFARRTSVDFAELEGQSLISLPAQSTLYTQTLELCHAHGFNPIISIICDDPYFIRKYVSENMGIALAPSISWKGRFRENTVLVPLENPQIYVSSYLIWDNTHYSSIAARTFREFLLEEAKNFATK